MKRFVVACPRNSSTGGPEALHQLVAALSSGPVDAFLWDPYSDGEPTEEDHYFAQYKVQWTQTEPTVGDVLVVPEVMGELIPRFYGNCQCIFWWLSVDNFYSADKYPIEILIQLFPQVIHVAQSHYASEFLRHQGISEVLMLTDYINQEFIAKHQELSSLSQNQKRDFDVAINTAKGFDRVSKVMTNSQDIKYVLLENMTREEVISNLSSSRIYLDLGTHPGTDRIPREAALLGCVIVTNTRGSAGNQIDVAINRDLFKYSDEDLGFEVTIQDGIRRFLKSLDDAISQQKNYVEWIIEAKNRFENEVSALIDQIQNLTYITSDFERIVASCVDLAYRDRDRIFHERNVLSIERDQLTADRDRIFHERNVLSIERDQLTADRDRIFHERNVLSIERNQLANELTAIKNSILWKFTYPVQIIGQSIKKLLRTNG
jgi:hypothetical protein